MTYTLRSTKILEFLSRKLFAKKFYNFVLKNDNSSNPELYFFNTHTLIFFFISLRGILFINYI